MAVYSTHLQFGVPTLSKPLSCFLLLLLLLLLPGLVKGELYCRREFEFEFLAEEALVFLLATPEAPRFAWWVGA